MDPLSLKLYCPWAQLRTTVIHFGFAPADKREGVQWRREDKDVASCGGRTIAFHPVSQNFKPHRGFVTMRIEHIPQHLELIKKRQHAQRHRDTSIHRECEGSAAWLRIRLFGDE